MLASRFPQHTRRMSLDLAKLIYKMAHGIRVDEGILFLKQIMGLGVYKHNNTSWLIFPPTIMGILQEQHQVPSLPGDKFNRDVTYKKDKRQGRDHGNNVRLYN